ncbi:uncharacterized protein AAEQ78_007657 isoform 5-T8 [Lycaon pictus]
MITNTWSAKLDIAFPLRLTGRRHRTLPVLGTALAQCMLRPQRFKDRPPHRVIFTCSPLLLQPLNINCRKHRHSNSTKPWGAGDPFPEFSWSTASLQGTDDSAHLTTLLQIAQPSIPLSKTHWLSKPSQRTAILIFSKYIQAVQKDTGWQPTMHQHQKPRWLRQEMTILDRKSTAKFDGDTVTRVKCPSSLSRATYGL